MNLLWGGMLLIGILYGAFNGRMQEITDAVLSASREAVTLCVTMTGMRDSRKCFAGRSDHGSASFFRRSRRIIRRMSQFP